MTSRYADRGPALQQWKSPLFAVAISAILHGAIWSAWLTRKAETEPEISPPKFIEVALVAAQPEPVPEPPKPQVQAPPAPPKVMPKPEKRQEKQVLKRPAKPKSKSTPAPTPEPEAMPKAVPEASPAPAAEGPSEAPSAPRPAPAPAPYVEASYKSPSLHNPPTRYPRLALERQWQGTVTLRVRVLANGSPGEIKLERSSGHAMLDDSTVEQVRNWRFIPARRGEQAVDSWVIVPIEYKLKH